jgi:predicted DNA-binding transcriptional regulator YafY
MMDGESNGHTKVFYGTQVTWKSLPKAEPKVETKSDLEQLAAALKGNDFVIDYVAADGRQSQERTVTNCSLKFKPDGSMYLSGWDATKNAVRSFLMSRITKMRLV